MDNLSNICREDLFTDMFPTEELHQWTPSEKIPMVVNEIKALKLELTSYLNERNFNVDEVAQELIELCKESKSLIDESVQCKREIERETMSDILKCVENRDIIANDLEKVKFTLNIVYDVVQTGKYFKDYEEFRRNNNYSTSVEILTDLTDFLNNPVEGFSELTMYQNLKTCIEVNWNDLMRDLTNEWDKMVSFSTDVNSCRSIIQINIKITDTKSNNDILQALSMSKGLHKKISEFSSFLMQTVLFSIIFYECTVYEETDELVTITIPQNNQIKPAYNAVISNIRLLFHFLYNKLNIEVQSHGTLLSMVGTEISAEFGSALIKDCLIDTIPNSITELQTYGRILAEIEDLQLFLNTVKFFPNDNFSILQYADNIDVLFASKTSQYFLESARSIMLKDLSIMMSIGVESVPTDTDSNNSIVIDEATEDALKIFDSVIPKSLFYFPRCMISKTAQEVLDLVHVMMEQAVQCSDLVCKRLYVTTRLVFELYDAVVPYHHENFLQTIPQYVALFHNNCIYLAHNLLTLGEKWSILLEGRSLDYSVSFVDLVQKLRDLGFKHLTVHMQQQRKQILDNIRSSDLNSLAVKVTLSENAEQAIRQCLRQLQLLKNVWIGVFPANVFTRLMAMLVNVFVDEIIHRVCTVEDISAEMAVQLTEIYSIVLKRAPNLFQNDNDIEKHIKSWIKLQEVIYILRGSLKDIEKRWSDGSGPLAKHFRTEELRSLIKALFQNTQFRANLLSKIK